MSDTGGKRSKKATSVQIPITLAKSESDKIYKHASDDLYHKAVSCDALSCAILAVPKYDLDKLKFDLRQFRVVEVGVHIRTYWKIYDLTTI